jgi:putative inorganic carbon (HCO3(-)) transporter
MPGRLPWPVYWPNLNRIGLVLLIIGLGISLSLLPLKIAGLAIVGSVLFALGLLHPKLGLYLLIPAIPFSSLFRLQIGGVNLGLMEILLGFMIVSWLVKMSARGEIIIPTPPLVWPFLLFLGVIGLSWLTAISLKASLVETLKWVEMLALYIFIGANFAAAESRRLVVLLLLAGMAQAGLGVYQFLFQAGPEGFLLFGGRFLRAFGTFQQPNPYGGYLGLILPLALSLTLWGLEQPGKLRPFAQGEPATRRSWTGSGQLSNAAQGESATRRSWTGSEQFGNVAQGGSRTRRSWAGWKQWPSLPLSLLAGSALGLMLAALFASQSRGAWIGFLGAAIVTILLKGGKWAIALATGLISLAILISMGALALLPATISRRFLDILPFINVPDIARVPLTDANFAILERLAHWQAALGMWQDHLWLGVGFGNYEVVYPAYAIGRWLDPLGHAHNYLLNVGAELGFIGLLGYLIFWAWVIAFALRALVKTETSSLNRAILAGCLGIITHLHIHNLLDNLYVQGMYLHIAVILSLITLMVIEREGEVVNLPHFEANFEIHHS